MIEKLIKSLKKDENLYYAYQANIAMSFFDAYYQHISKTKKRTLNTMEVHKISNDAAKHFLNLLIGKKKSKNAKTKEK